MSVWISHIVISYLNLNRWARKGKYIEILCMDWLCTIMIRSYIGCWYPVRRKWNQEVWWWRWRGLGTVCWGSTITLIIRWRGGQWGEPDQSSSLDLTLHLSRLVPTFMFGLTGDLLDSLYGGPDKIPTRGMLTATTGWFGTGSICSSC